MDENIKIINTNTNEGKSLNILCIGDPHYMADNETETNMFEKQLEDIIDNNSFDFVVNLGDTHHTHNKLDVGVVKRVTKFFSMLNNKCKKVYILVGNHDRPHNKIYLTDDHPYNSFKEWGTNFVIVDKVIIEEHKGCKFVFSPYVETGRFTEALLTVGLQSPYEDISCIFAHQEFKGAKMNSITSNIGDIYDQRSPICISGHIHEHDQLQNNILYVGSPLQHSFSDKDNKTLSYIRFEGPINSNKLVITNHQRINVNIPKKIYLRLTVEQLMSYIPPENSNIKIKVIGDVNVISNMMKTDHIQKLLTQGVKIKDGGIIPKQKTEILSTFENGSKVKLSYQHRLYTELIKSTPEMQNTFLFLFPNFNKK